MTLVKKWAPRLILAAAGLILFYQLVLVGSTYLVDEWKAVSFPYPLDYGEGPLLDQTLRLARFQNIYAPDLSQPPYTIANYPPLFLLLQVPFAWTIGPAFWYGRSISALGVLAGALFIGLILVTLTKSRLAGVIAGLTLLAFPYVLFWAPMNRVDSLALGLSLAGLWVTVRNGASRRGRIAAAVLLTAAIFTKQSYGLAAPFAAFVWLLHDKPRRKAFELAAMVAGLGIILVLLLSLLTRGGFLFNTVAANVNPFYWKTVKDYVDAIWDHVWPLVLGGGAFLALGWWWPGTGRNRFRAWWLVAPYLVGAALSAVTVGKAGSSVNYMMELCAAFGMVAGSLAAWSGRFRWIQIAVLLLLAYQASSLLDWYHKDHQHWLDDKYENPAQIAGLIEITRAANGPVLADEYMGVIPLAGKSLYFQPFEFKQLSGSGLWNEQAFVDDILKGKFAVIILYDPAWDSRHERWTSMQLAAISIAYTYDTKLADATVLVPKIR